jgi:MFS transporter, FSR family, fosmidomycin resistance protein
MVNPGHIAVIESCRRSDLDAAFLSIRSVTTLSIYGAAHLVVDACCAAVAFGIVSKQSASNDTFIAMLLLYHALAFGLQAPIGLAVDALDMPRFAAVLGCFLSAMALMFTSSPMLSITIAGVGNAIYHIGGGIVCLRITPQCVTAPGLFVAPGSLGLFLGVILGKSGQLMTAPLFPIAVVLCFFMACTLIPKAETPAKKTNCINRGELIIGLMLITIGIRSCLGFLTSFSWETQPLSLLLLTMATVFGKAFGGFFADRWGWIRVGVGSLLASLPFMACSSIYPLAAIPGLFLLNMTMPIALVAVASAIPNHSGFAFGLTCLAILFGSLPSLLGVSLGNPIFVSLAIVLSVFTLYHSLKELSPASIPEKKLQVLR